jgi:hypothetical protein
MEIVPGKAILATLRRRVRELFSVNVSDYRIVSSFHLDEVPVDLKRLIEGLERFRKMKSDPTKPQDGEAEPDAV